MAINLVLSLTLNGKDAFWNSENTGVKLDITHLQFGARNRLTTGEESFLNQPKQYTQIQNGSKISPDQVRIMATMPGIENYNVNEIGLWSGVPDQAGSILIAYKSVQTGFIAQMVSGIDLVFTYDMAISTADIDHINIIKDFDQSSTYALLADHVVDRDAHPFYATTDTEQTISGAKTFSKKAIFSGGLKGELEGNASTASALKEAQKIGGVPFDGTENINLPGVNAKGNQDTSGNAATATKLADLRTISLKGDATGSAQFDGSGDIEIYATLQNGIGINHSWKDVRASRFDGITYTNTSETTITVFIGGGREGHPATEFYLGGELFASWGGVEADEVFFSVPIPPGVTYGYKNKPQYYFVFRELS